MTTSEQHAAVTRAEVPYDAGYAATYSTRWWNDEQWTPDHRHFESLLGEHVVGADSWLDVGCGTGHFLSCFPDVTRAGVDISDAMLAVASEANPDAVEFRVGDVREPYAPWNDSWKVVSCTGEPWSYLRDDDDFRRWVARMAEWTASDGVCINQIPDIQELVGVDVDYWFTEEKPPAGHVSILGVIWDMAEHDIVHGRMIWPSVDRWVRWYAEHFTHLEIVHPTPGAGVIFGRTIVASGKRLAGDTTPATIVFDPPPAQTTPLERVEAEVARLSDEVARLVQQAAHDEEQSVVYKERVERELAVALHEADWLRSTYGHLPPPSSDGSVYLGATSTRRLGKELARRVNPLRRLSGRS